MQKIITMFILTTGNRISGYIISDSLKYLLIKNNLNIANENTLYIINKNYLAYYEMNMDIKHETKFEESKSILKQLINKNVEIKTLSETITGIVKLVYENECLMLEKPDLNKQYIVYPNFVYIKFKEND